MVTDRQVDAVRDIFIFIELENTKGVEMTKIATHNKLKFKYDKICRTCGQMDKASDFGSEDCRFESCHVREDFAQKFMLHNYKFSI